VGSFFAALRAASPSLVAPAHELGPRTYEGRTLFAYCLGATCGAPASAPGLLLTSLLHGREPLGLLVNLHAAHALLAREAAGDASAAALLALRRLVVFPLGNPDAYAANLAAAGGGPAAMMARKNRRPGCGSGRTADVGVDLNRNFDFSWALDEVGSSSSPCAEDFRGGAPFSEPESAALRELAWWAGGAGGAFAGATAPSPPPASPPAPPSAPPFAPNLTVALNWHSYGRFINVPWAVRGTAMAPRAYAALLAVAGALAGAGSRGGGGAFGFGHPFDGGLYTCNGEASDWLLAASGLLAFSPELGPEFSREPFEEGMWPPAGERAGLVGEGARMAERAAWAAGALLELPAAPDVVVVRTADGRAATLRFAVENGGAAAPKGTVVVAAIPRPRAVARGGAAAAAATAAAAGAPPQICFAAEAPTSPPLCFDEAWGGVVEALAAAAGGDARCSAAAGGARAATAPAADGAPALLGSGGDGAATRRAAAAAVHLVPPEELAAVRDAVVAAGGGAPGGAGARVGVGANSHPKRIDVSGLLGEGAARARRGGGGDVFSGSPFPIGGDVYGAAVRLPGAAFPPFHAVSGFSLTVAVGAEDGGVECGGGGGGGDAALAFLAVSDEELCAVYAVPCGVGPPTLVFRGRAGCLPCAALRVAPLPPRGGGGAAATRAPSSSASPPPPLSGGGAQTPRDGSASSDSGGAVAALGALLLLAACALCVAGACERKREAAAGVVGAGAAATRVPPARRRPPLLASATASVAAAAAGAAWGAFTGALQRGKGSAWVRVPAAEEEEGEEEGVAAAAAVAAAGAKGGGAARKEGPGDSAHAAASDEPVAAANAVRV
jgi:hypothetical protein